MAEDKKKVHAQSVYKSFCDTLDKMGWQYTPKESELSLYYTVSGNDIPMSFIAKVDGERQLVRLMSKLPVTFLGDGAAVDGAVATSLINYFLADGSFDYDFAHGEVYFRMTASFIDSFVSEEYFKYLVICSAHTVDEFNDKLLLLSKGAIDINQFIRQLPIK